MRNILITLSWLLSFIPSGQAATPDPLFLLQNLEHVNQAFVFPKDAQGPVALVSLPADCAKCAGEALQWTRALWSTETKDIDVMFLVQGGTWRLARAPFLKNPQRSLFWHDPGGRALQKLRISDNSGLTLVLVKAGGTEAWRGVLRGPVTLNELKTRLKQP